MSPQMRLLPSHCGKREDKTLWGQELLSLDSLEVQDLVITGSLWVINVWLSVRLTMLRHLVLHFRGEGLRIWSHDFQSSQTRKIEYGLAPTASMDGFRRMSVLDIQVKTGPANPAPLPTSPFDWMEVLENLYLKAIFLWAETSNNQTSPCGYGLRNESWSGVLKIQFNTVAFGSDTNQITGPAKASCA